MLHLGARMLACLLGQERKKKKKRKRLFFEDFISKRKKDPEKGERFQKKLYEYIAPKNKKNVITDHILRHAYHDTRKTEKKRKNINNVITNHIVKHMYLMTKKERKKERKKKKKEKKKAMTP
jgi:hypothetical protein